MLLVTETRVKCMEIQKVKKNDIGGVVMRKTGGRGCTWFVFGGCYGFVIVDDRTERERRGRRRKSC